MRIHDIIMVEAQIKKNSSGEEYVQIKCPNLNMASSKAADAAQKKMFKLLDDAATEFAGVKISNAFTQGSEYKIYERVYFIGGDGEQYYWVGVDTENPLGFSVRLVKSNDKNVDSSKLAAVDVVSTPAPRASKEKAEQDQEVKEQVRIFVNTNKGVFSSAKASDSGSFIRFKNFSANNSVEEYIDLSVWERGTSADDALATSYQYDKAFVLKTNKSIKFFVFEDYGMITKVVG